MNYISILMYHQVGKFDNPKLHRAVYCHVDRFRSQMQFMKAWGYNVISLKDACDCIFKNKPIPPKAVVLTFDDGCDNFREYAWPILKEFNYPATMFLVADLIGKETKWMDDVPEKSPLMTKEAILELHKEGVNFGSHTLNHVKLALCDEKMMKEEIFSSKAKLEDLLGKEIIDFCYPYGNYNQKVADTVKEAGYQTGLTCIRAAANFAKSPFDLPRKAISFGDSLIGWWWKVRLKNSPKNK